MCIVFDVLLDENMRGDKLIPMSPFAIHGGIYTIMSGNDRLARTQSSVIAEPGFRELAEIVKLVLPRPVLAIITPYDMEKLYKLYRIIGRDDEAACVVAALYSIVNNYPASMVYDRCIEQLGHINTDFRKFLGRVMRAGMTAIKNGIIQRAAPTNIEIFAMNTAMYICKRRRGRHCDIAAAVARLVAKQCGIQEALAWARKIAGIGNRQPRCGCVRHEGIGKLISITFENGCIIVLHESAKIESDRYYNFNNKSTLAINEKPASGWKE